MFAKKLLIGGTVAVGSAATIAVATNQLGKPSDSKKTKSTPEQLAAEAKIKQEQLEAERVQRIEDRRGKVTKWLGENKGTNNWLYSRKCCLFMY